MIRTKFQYAGRSVIISFLLAVLCLSITPGCGKDEKKMAIGSLQRLVPEEISGWKLTDSVETYDRATIYDYIDGAGEVYLSYDFQEVSILRFAKPGEPDITVELFDMGSPEDAYGVFSHAREKEQTGVGEGYEYRGGLLCFWRARYYLCILAQKESAATKEAVFALASGITERLPDPAGRPELVDMLPGDNLIRESVRYFHTHASLNYHYFLSGENILNLNPDTRAVLAQYNPGPLYILGIRYQDPADAQEAYSGFIEGYIPEAAKTGSARTDDGNWVVSRVKQEYIIIGLEAPLEAAADRLINAFLDNIFGTSQAGETR
ncbi:MAG: hypothetical protein JSV44_06180 [Candidatus Zixiibacteriota bacterium]|nr:MAG: hypothetical protein JSV44_06180 [candidate division Zixibacteria bacterium]